MRPPAAGAAAQHAARTEYIAARYSCTPRPGVALRGFAEAIASIMPLPCRAGDWFPNPLFIAPREASSPSSQQLTRGWPHAGMDQHELLKALEGGSTQQTASHTLTHQDSFAPSESVNLHQYLANKTSVTNQRPQRADLDLDLDLEELMAGG